MKTQDIVLIALFTAITVVLGLMPPITLGFIPVPITLQTLGVMLAGVVLGAKRGGLAMLLLVLLVAIGLPVLAGGRGGLGVLAGPTAGFVYGWVPGAFVSGLLAERLAARERRPTRQVVAFFLSAAIGGIGVVYAAGIPWLAFVAGIGFQKAAFGSLAFVPGDLAKAIVAALVARGVHRAYPVLPGR